MPEFSPIDVPQTPFPEARVPNLTEPGQTKLEDVGQGIVLAAAKGAEIAGKRQALERQLLKMELDKQESEIRHDLAVQKMAQQAWYQEQNLFLRDKAINSLQEERDRKAQKYSDSIDDLGEYSNELAKLDKNDPAFWNKALQVTSDHSAGYNTPGGRRLLSFRGNESNAAKAAQTNAIFSNRRALEKDISNLDWHTLRPRFDIFENEANWVSNPEIDPQTGLQVIDKEGKGKFKDDKFTYLGKDQLGADQYMTLSGKQYRDLRKRWVRSTNDVNNIPQQITDPTLGVQPYPVDPTGGGGSMQYGSEAQARQAGHQTGETVSVYDPNSGTYRPYVLD